MSRVTALPALRNRRTAAGSGRIAIFTNSSHTAPDFPNLFITFAVDISKGCLTIRLRLYPLNRIRVMPKPGCIIFQRIPLFSSLTFKSSDMKRFLLPIAAVALCVAANTASAENPANAVITAATETPAAISLTAGVTNAATAADATRSAAFVTAAAVPPAKTSEAITAAAARPGPKTPCACTACRRSR